MSGHSKWASIKHKKGAADAKRGKLFSKLAKAITVAARTGGSDQAMNFGLRLAIEKAKQANMPKDNIERAIARGSGEGADGVILETALYEAMGPGGSSILIEALTDNKNRTLASIKTICNKNGGNLDAKILWQFDRKGVVRVEDVSGIEDRDTFELELIEAGAEDLSWDEGLEVIGTLSDLQALEAAVSGAGLIVGSAEPEYIAKDKLQLSEEDEGKLMGLLELLDDDDDVNAVFTNAA